MVTLGKGVVQFLTVARTVVVSGSGMWPLELKAVSAVFHHPFLATDKGFEPRPTTTESTQSRSSK